MATLDALSSLKTTWAATTRTCVFVIAANKLASGLTGRVLVCQSLSSDYQSRYSGEERSDYLFRAKWG